jgi:HPt (histidine-containing phosphotransfer) domain-containing protein
MSITHTEINQTYEPNLATAIPSHRPFTANDDPLMEALNSFESAQMEGEPDIIVELIDLYLEDAARRVSAMQEAATQADEKAIKWAAHALRGSSAHLGARRIATLCQEIEQHEPPSMFPDVETLLTLLVLEFERVRQVFIAERARRS